MADEKDDEVFTDDQEKSGPPEPAVNPADLAEPAKAEEPTVVPVAPIAPPPPVKLTFPEGTTAKDLAEELFILMKIQVGTNHSPMPQHLFGFNREKALARYHQIMEILGKIKI